MNIEDEDYADKVSEWINNLEDFNDVDDLNESFYFFAVNYPPFKGLVVDVTKYKGKRAIIFYKRNSFFKIHYPKKIEYSLKEDNRKRMFSIKTNEYWAYDERFEFLETISFGMDMTMPFLAQQDWKPV